MASACSECGVNFMVSESDRALLNKLAPTIAGFQYTLPDPKLCPRCRQQRRLAFYNRRTLHKRTCDNSGEQIVSIFAQESPFTVYEKDFWFGDEWDPLEFGKDFDFNRPFFEQFRELMESVPLPSLTLLGGADNINSDYNNDAFKLKNCYLTFDGTSGEDSMYGESYNTITDCTDFLHLTNCQLCYECVQCSDCYNCRYCTNCVNTTDCWFSRDCTGCTDCFGCSNLVQKQHCIFNEQKSPEEYRAFLQQFDSGNFSILEAMKKKAEDFLASQPVRATHGVQNEDSTGDNISRCRNAFSCFDSSNLEDCRYVCNNMCGGKDEMDVDVWGETSELLYNTCVVGDKVRSSISCYYVSEGCSDVHYSIYCSRNSNNLFGCIGLRHKSFCIFNKQYSVEEYERLVRAIVQHMQKTGEWGEFFPPSCSAFGYNETVARDIYPLTEEEARERNWQWREVPDYVNGVEKTIDATRLPDSLTDTPDDVLNWALTCPVTGRPFRLTKTELAFYRQHNLPIPRLHPDERHRRRVAKRNPSMLWKRACSTCGTEALTSYAESRPEPLLCVECYGKTFH